MKIIENKVIIVKLSQNGTQTKFIDYPSSSLVCSMPAQILLQRTGQHPVLVCLGPIASIMVNKLGCRISQMLGGTCVLLGLGLSSLSTESWHAFLLYGALSGRVGGFLALRYNNMTLS